MSVFRFKRFEVRNERSAMKVNTDGVLLGAATDVFPTDVNVLDIGTGTGTVALMLAQKLDGTSESWNIQGIDIDLPSSEEAALNFSASPWARHLVSVNMGLRAFRASGGAPRSGYSLIVSNPPYYDNSLRAPDARRNSARHTGDAEDPSGAETLSYREIIEYASEVLGGNGRVSLILPADQEKPLVRFAAMYGFEPWKILRIRTVERKPVSRLVVQFRRRGNVDQVSEELLTLLDDEGKRTSQQASLTTDYYL